MTEKEAESSKQGIRLVEGRGWRQRKKFLEKIYEAPQNFSL